MGLSAILYLLLRGDVPLNVMAQSMVAGVDIVTLVAIPFFMLAGELMNESGITERLVRFAQYFVGRIRGGLAYVTVIVNVIMAGVSGSAVADASAVSSVLLPAMARDGYDRRFAAAINASAAVIGPIIPPSIPMVFIAVISDLSIGRLFLGGVVPGLLMGIFLAVTIYLHSLRHPLPATEFKRGLGEFLRLLGQAFLALMAPVIILAGVVFGVVTIVEVAFLAVLYVLLVGTLAYRTIHFTALPCDLCPGRRHLGDDHGDLRRGGRLFVDHRQRAARTSGGAQRSSRWGWAGSGSCWSSIFSSSFWAASWTRCRPC